MPTHRRFRRSASGHWRIIIGFCSAFLNRGALTARHRRRCCCWINSIEVVTKASWKRAITARLFAALSLPALTRSNPPTDACTGHQDSLTDQQGKVGLVSMHIRITNSTVDTKNINRWSYSSISEIKIQKSLVHHLACNVRCEKKNKYKTLNQEIQRSTTHYETMHVERMRWHGCEIHVASSKYVAIQISLDVNSMCFVRTFARWSCDGQYKGLIARQFLVHWKQQRNLFIAILRIQSCTKHFTSCEQQMCERKSKRRHVSSAA